MPELIDEKTRAELIKIFAGLVSPVRLVYFTQEHACAACRDQETMLKALADISEKITATVHDLVADVSLAREYGISKVPATAILSETDYGIRFYGITAGYEFGSLIEAIVMVSKGESGLDPEIETLLKLIDKPVHLEVMVTLTCPYCPKMVHLAHQMALVNEHIRSDMVESSEFPQLVQRYEVNGVPRTVINERPAFEGALPALDATLEILKTIKPKEYERIDAQMREARGERFATIAAPDHTYQTIIVGAGPAALSAAVYASRKNLDVALVGEKVGGQITNTASIENWLGIPSISGQALAEAFRDHAERYPIAEILDVAVESIELQDGEFHLTTKSGTIFRSHSVIYCAGKEYRKLGVPGEDRFIGKGIAFCATCDAPLFKDKRVAVIGGGNSAFTAARDLLSYAREIHIINILPDFQADPVLIKEVEKARHVTLHPSMQVREFTGRNRLGGVRIESNDGKERSDLAVDGVFLEIGLIPNTACLKGFIELNDLGEIPTNKDQSTSIPGFFAAGDVTDEIEKQIVVAAGAGAKAALSAYSYLLDRALLTSGQAV
ncbi:MAG TPA: FAD-dependent oxidoreductase [Deltaproteobacteria bacterium]|nr:FAD-dependent oxidoreductase [Deltaproteobacteria bacterium]